MWVAYVCGDEDHMRMVVSILHRGFEGVLWVRGRNQQGMRKGEDRAGQNRAAVKVRVRSNESAANIRTASGPVQFIWEHVNVDADVER